MAARMGKCAQLKKLKLFQMIHHQKNVSSNWTRSFPIHAVSIFKIEYSKEYLFSVIHLAFYIDFLRDLLLSVVLVDIFWIFDQEISLLSQLSHANIVHYYGSDLVQVSFRLSVYFQFTSIIEISRLLLLV